MKSVVKNSLFNAIYQVLNMLFPLISATYVARVLMAEGVGRVAYAQNIASYFVLLAALGVPTVGLRAIANVRDDKQKLNKTFSELAILNAATTFISVACYLILVFCNTEFRMDLQLYLATGLVVAFNIINIDWLYQGHEEYIYIVVRSIVIKIMSLAALFLFVKSADDYVIYALISSLATCGNYIFNVVHARNYVRLQIRGLDFTQHIKPLFLFAGSLLFATIYARVDVTMLGILIGDISVGYYSYAHKILQIGISFCAAVTSAFLPRLSYCYHHDKEQFYTLIDKGIQIISFLSIPVATGLFLLAPEAINLLFGDAFLPAAKTLRIFAVLIVVFAFGNLTCYQLMICSGNEKKHVIVLACAAGINVILNAVLIPKFQHNGAAVASVLTELFINVLECIYFARLLGIKYKFKAISQAVMSTVIMAVSIVCIKFFVYGNIPILVCSLILGGGMYILVNVLIKNQLVFDAIKILRNKLVK